MRTSQHALLRRRLRRTALAVTATALAAAGALGAAPPSAANNSAPARITPAAGPTGTLSTASCQVTLPGGLRARVTQQGARPTGTADGDRPAIAASSGGHRYLIPTDALSTIARTGLAPYDTDALAERTCGAKTAAAVSAPSRTTAAAPTPTKTSTGARTSPGTKTSTGQGDGFTMARVTFTTPRPQGATNPGLLVLTDLDRTSYAYGYLSETVRSTLRLSLPAGHYAAVYTVADPAGGLRVVTDPDVTVRGTETVTLDPATATVPLTVPATPRPAQLVSGEADFWAHDDDTADMNGLVPYALFFGASTTGRTGILTNTTGPAHHGRFEMVTAFAYASPAGTAHPYTYDVAKSYDRLPARYPTAIAPSDLTTVHTGYSAPSATGDALLLRDIEPEWAAQAGSQHIVDIADVPVGTVRDEYFSSSPLLVWHSLLDFETTATLVSDGGTTYPPGSRLTRSWLGGPEHPAANVDTGVDWVPCGACATPGSMDFSISGDADENPGDVGVRFADATSDATLERDGTVVGTGTAGLDGVSVPVPAGRARYRLHLTTTRTAGTTAPALDGATDTAWTFTSDPGRGPAVGGDTHCASETAATPCSALPLLYTSVSVDGADLQHGLTPGRHAVHLDVTPQQFSTATRAGSARLQASYDGGTTWRDTPLTGLNGSYSGSLDVPAAASGGTVSFRLSAGDVHGDRTDQTLSDAYAVR